MTGTQPSACALRREVRQLQRKKRHQRGPLVDRVLKKQGLQRALLAVWALSEQDLVKATKFLEKREFLAPGDSMHDLEVWLKTQTLSAAESGVDLLAQTTKAQKTSVKTTDQFLLELEVYTWVRLQNVKKGVAPSNTAVWNQSRAASAFSLPSRASLSQCSKSSKRSMNQWVARWRQRWQVRRDSLKDGSKVTLDTARAKVVRYRDRGTKKNIRDCPPPNNTWPSNGR